VHTRTHNNNTHAHAKTHTHTNGSQQPSTRDPRPATHDSRPATHDPTHSPLPAHPSHHAEKTDESLLDTTRRHDTRSIGPSDRRTVGRSVCSATCCFWEQQLQLRNARKDGENGKKRQKRQKRQKGDPERHWKRISNENKMRISEEGIEPSISSV
jgi:hypothetical protein